MDELPPLPPSHCSKCDGPLAVSTATRLDTTDLIGATLVGLFVFGGLGLLLFTGAGGPALRGLLVIGGIAAFGLNHMIKRHQKTSRKCIYCGHTEDSGE